MYIESFYLVEKKRSMVLFRNDFEKSMCFIQRFGTRVTIIRHPSVYKDHMYRYRIITDNIDSISTNNYKYHKCMSSVDRYNYT